jgi:hypothetical protein
MSPKPKGQGAFTLRDGTEDKGRMLRPGWASVLDRWGAIPYGYALCRCGCRVTMLDGSNGGPQEWVVRIPDPPSRPRWMEGRFPVAPSWPREGDLCPQGCGQPIRRVTRVPRELQRALEELAPLAVAGSETLLDSPRVVVDPEPPARHLPDAGSLRQYREPPYRQPWCQYRDGHVVSVGGQGHMPVPCDCPPPTSRGRPDLATIRARPRQPTMWEEQARVAAERRQRGGVE